MTTNRFQKPMQNLYDAHKEFQQSFYWRGRDKDKKAAIDLARDKFWAALNFLWDTELDSLYRAVAAGGVAAADEIIDFLAVDIPAYRTGYAKEWFLRRLKKLPLTEAHREHLKAIALEMCGKPNYRREFTEWIRLIIVLADESFVSELQELSKSSDEFVRKKAERTLSVIFNHRKDLKLDKL